MEKVIEHHTEETGHPTKQVGIIVGCTKCEYTLYTLRNTEHFIGENLDGTNDFLSKRMKLLSPEEKAWEQRPIRLTMEKVKKRAEKERITKLAREVLKATQMIYPCKVRGTCEYKFNSKKDLRRHLIGMHSESDLKRTIEYYLED